MRLRPLYVHYCPHYRFGSLIPHSSVTGPFTTHTTHLVTVGRTFHLTHLYLPTPTHTVGLHHTTGYCTHYPLLGSAAHHITHHSTHTHYLVYTLHTTHLRHYTWLVRPPHTEHMPPPHTLHTTLHAILHCIPHMDPTHTHTHTGPLPTQLHHHTPPHTPPSGQFCLTHIYLLHLPPAAATCHGRSPHYGWFTRWFPRVWFHTHGRGWDHWRAQHHGCSGHGYSAYKLPTPRTFPITHTHTPLHTTHTRTYTTYTLHAIWTLTSPWTGSRQFQFLCFSLVHLDSLAVSPWDRLRLSCAQFRGSPNLAARFHAFFRPSFPNITTACDQGLIWDTARLIPTPALRLWDTGFALQDPSRSPDCSRLPVGCSQNLPVSSSAFGAQFAPYSWFPIAAVRQPPRQGLDMADAGRIAGLEPGLMCLRSPLPRTGTWLLVPRQPPVPDHAFTLPLPVGYPGPQRRADLPRSHTPARTRPTPDHTHRTGFPLTTVTHGEPQLHTAWTTPTLRTFTHGGPHTGGHTHSTHRRLVDSSYYTQFWTDTAHTTWTTHGTDLNTPGI